jgi:hypothetical protein
MSRQSARSGLRPDRKNYRNFPRPWGIIVVVSGEVYLSLHVTVIVRREQAVQGSFISVPTIPNRT